MTKKKIQCCVDLDPETNLEGRLEEVIEGLKFEESSLKDKYPSADDFYFSFIQEYESVYFTLSYSRDETDEEYAKRLNTEKKNKEEHNKRIKDQKEKEYKQYLKLKKKFEKENG